jgi:hypothetical protein
MKLHSLIIILIVILISSCATIKNENIIFNQEKQLYEYQINKKNKVTLRNENQLLVDTSNYEAFKDELVRIKNNYPFKKRLENENLLKNIDMELSMQYAKVNQAILDNEFEKAIDELNTTTIIYPEIVKYSDCYFLKAFAFEKLGKLDSATFYYEKFISMSSQKYSARFRGYRDYDLNDSIFIAERNYSKNFMSVGNQDVSTNFTVIEPKYYYGSIQPGYTLNREDIPRNTQGLLMFLIGNDLSNEMTFGAQYYYRINDRININPRFVYSGNMKEFSLGLPIQIYKSKNNNFGLKLTPFVNYLGIDSVKVDDKKYLFNENVFNFGGRISVGYYPIQKLAIGAYYQYNFFNENNKILSNSSQIEVWIKNEYDLSLYYNIYKGFSLKAGVKNNDFVAGFFWSGWEIAYNISTPGLILKVDMY